MKRIWLLALLWLALCLGGALWAALGLQAKVGQLAGAKVEELAKDTEVLADLKVHAEGRAVVLSGSVNRSSDVDRVMQTLGADVRMPGAFGKGGPYNPVQRVVNQLSLIPRPQGWGVLAATSGAVHLRGMAGSQNEADRLALAVKSSGQLDNKFVSALMVDGEIFVESDNLEKTIQAVPSMSADSIKQGFLAVARWGGDWHVLDLEKPAEVLRREVLALGLPQEAWETELFAEVSRVRSAREAFVTDSMEKKRQGALASGHVVMAVRGSEILLRGELGSDNACKLLADAIRVSNPDRIIIDELAHSSHRKPDDSPRLLTSALPKLAGGLLVKYLTVGTPETGWKSMDLDQLDIEKQDTITQEMLPEGMDRRLVLPDVSTALAWLLSIDGAPKMRDGASTPPYLMIAAVGNHVYLRGVVAEEGMRTQVEAAARRLYSSRELDVAVRLDTSCQAVGLALQTIATMPPPPSPETAGFLSFSFAGEEWHGKPALARLLEADGLEQAGLLPEGFSVNLIMPDILAVAPAVRAHLSQLSKGPPGIPMQPSRQP